MKTQPIDRSHVNEQAAQAQDLPKSGFDLSYNMYSDFMLGRLHVSGYQHTMPADKLSGNNLGDFTLNRLVTPMVSDIEVCQHNFFVNLRSIDRTFEDAFAPAAHNEMNASWRVPTFKLNELVMVFFRESGKNTTDTFPVFGSGQLTAQQAAALNTYVQSFFAPTHQQSTHWRQYHQFYMGDIYDDLYTWFTQFNNAFTQGMPTEDALYLWYKILLTPLFGSNSLLDSLGYNYLKDSDLKRLAAYGPVSTYKDLFDLIDDTPQSEYALRAYYAVWYEYYRDTHLEPVSASFPTWKDFGSSSIFPVRVVSNPVPVAFYLAVRMRSWAKDMFTGSSPDDLMRHVFAPVMATSTGRVFEQVPGQDNRNYEQATFNAFGQPDNHNITAYTLFYNDPVTGSQQQITCPLPARVNDALAALDGDSKENNFYQLDLFNLRQSQMLERYLKRNFYFGDEYRDRMIAHYGSVVSDYSVKRPILLSSSVSTIDREQQIAPVNTPTTSVGDRTVTATASSKGDGFEFFSEEFGIVLNIVSFMPRAQYAGMCPQNLLIRQIDFPIPEFAANNEEFGRVCEIACTGVRSNEQFKTFGHYPYAHAYRSRVDEVHGSFLNEKQAYTFRRLFGLDSPVDAPQLNYEFIHCRPQLDMFADTQRFTGQLYGRVSHNFYVERVLPTPVEII